MIHATLNTYVWLAGAVVMPGVPADKRLALTVSRREYLLGEAVALDLTFRSRVAEP
jgi:hypothetical protein